MAIFPDSCLRNVGPWCVNPPPPTSTEGKHQPCERLGQRSKVIRRHSIRKVCTQQRTERRYLSSRNEHRLRASVSCNDYGREPANPSKLHKSFDSLAKLWLCFFIVMKTSSLRYMKWMDCSRLNGRKKKILS